MPYINQRARGSLRDYPTLITTPGELNYLVTNACLIYLSNVRDIPPVEKRIRYEDYNAVIGALECAKLEIYRRMIAPYEDVKIKENGDVYPEQAKGADSK